MNEKIITQDCAELEFDGRVIIKGQVKLSKLSCTDLRIEFGGNLDCGGNLRFSYHLKFKLKLNAKIIRLAPTDEIERRFWIEKLNLFGFPELALKIKVGCMDNIRKKLEPYAKELLACKLWTLTERLAIKSWIDGKVEFELGGLICQ